MGLINVLQGVIRADALRCTPLLQQYSGSDGALVAELALHGQFYEIPERLFYRRMHPQAFSSMTSFEAQRDHISPHAKASPSLILWRRHLQYLAAITRTPLSPAEKLALVYTVLRLVLAIRGNLARELTDAIGAPRRSRTPLRGTTPHLR
jgi:hypothetical protein